jgi:hypothetical protein
MPTPGKKKDVSAVSTSFLQPSNDLSSYMLAFTQFLLTPYSLTSRHLSQFFFNFFSLLLKFSRNPLVKRGVKCQDFQFVLTYSMEQSPS